MENEIRWLLQEKYRGRKTVGFLRDVKRLKAGEPLDYVIGFTDFLGCKIDVSKKPLIPRVETEFWTEQAIEEIKGGLHFAKASRGKISNLEILDIFSGSGAIGIAVVKNVNTHTGVRVACVFADSEKNCIEQIKVNCKLNKLPKSQYQIIQSDVFENITGRFDYIFANPPYIPKTRKKKVQESVLKHEPHAALWGGEYGMGFITPFLEQAREFLNSGGNIFMEFDPQQKPTIAKLAKKFGYTAHKFHKDQYGKWRWITLEK